MLKSLSRLAIVIWVAMASTACSLSYYRHISNSDYQTTDGLDVNIAMNLHGPIEVNRDETEIEYLAPGSRIKITSLRSPQRRELVLKGSKGGELTTDYEVNGREADFDEDAKQWLSSVVPIIYSQSGVDIPRRVEKLYREGGEELVLARIEPIRSDYDQGRYLTYLIETKSLSRDAIDRTIAFLVNIESDYELTKTINSLIDEQSLSDSQLLNLIDQSKNIQSDYEMAKLATAFAKKDLSPKVLTELSYLVAGYVQSDYEQAKILKALVKNKQYGEHEWFALLDSSKSIQSDYELSEVLERVLDNRLSDAVLTEVVSLTQSHISSSSEQADVFEKLIKKNELTPALKRTLVSAIEDISSDYEQNKLLKLLLA